MPTAWLREWTTKSKSIWVEKQFLVFDETNLDFGGSTNRPFPSRLNNFYAFLNDIFYRESSAVLWEECMFVRQKQHVEYERMSTEKTTRERGFICSNKNRANTMIVPVQLAMPDFELD